MALKEKAGVAKQRLGYTLHTWSSMVTANLERSKWNPSSSVCGGRMGGMCGEVQISAHGVAIHHAPPNERARFEETKREPLREQGRGCGACYARCCADMSF